MDIFFEYFWMLVGNGRIGYTRSCSFTIAWQWWTSPSVLCWGRSVPRFEVFDETISTKSCDRQKRAFNCRRRYSRRRNSCCTFGVITSYFRILKGPTCCNERWGLWAIRIVGVLYNFIHIREGAFSGPEDFSYCEISLSVTEGQPGPHQRTSWAFILRGRPCDTSTRRIDLLISVEVSNNSGPGSVVGIATGYGLDGPGIESRRGSRFSAPVQTGPGAHPASSTMGSVSFPGERAAGAWRWPLTPFKCRWSWKSRAIPVLPLWAVRPVQSLRACTRVHFTFLSNNSSRKKDK